MTPDEDQVKYVINTYMLELFTPTHVYTTTHILLGIKIIDPLCFRAVAMELIKTFLCLCHASLVVWEL